jgi:subtilisin family serine protease
VVRKIPILNTLQQHIDKPYSYNINTGILNFKGSYLDYNIKLINYDNLDPNENIIVFSDKKSSNKEYIEKGVRYLNFKDIKGYSINDEKPLHAKDIIDIADNLDSIILKKEDLLYNDYNLHNKTLHIKGVTKPVGCIVKLLNNNDIEVKFTKDYNRVASFQYTIEDENGLINDSNIPVYFRTPNLPKDPDFFDQWYLFRSNIVPAWEISTGKGVNIAVHDQGLVPLHQDIQKNLLSVTKADSNHFFSFNENIYFHALGVAGVIAAERNDEYITGVAYDSTISSIQLQLSKNSDNQSKSKRFDWFKQYDIINNSWGAAEVAYKDDDINNNINKFFDQIHSSYKNAANYGRNTLGSIILFASGNAYRQGYDSNDNLFLPSPYIITVSGFNKATNQLLLESYHEKFATSGSNNLISAPASNFLTLHADNLKFDEQLKLEYEDTVKYVEGTSFSCPLVSGIVALMLEANPNLGWRDVQDILVISAKKIDEAKQNVKYFSSNSSASSAGNEQPPLWQNNKAVNWNGGGLHYNREYGFGEADGYAAVRLAQNWLLVQTSKNMKTISSSTPFALNEVIKTGVTKFDFEINNEIEIEYVSLDLFAHNMNIADIEINLISPNGTRSTILYKPGNVEGQTSHTNTVQNLNIKLGSTNFRGEQSLGKWIMEIVKNSSSSYSSTISNNSILENYSLKLFGKEKGFNKNLYFTNEVVNMDKLGNNIIKLLTDKQYNTINASALTLDMSIDLTCSQIPNMIANKKIELGPNIKNVISGDGNTQFIGDTNNNIFVPGRSTNKFTSNGGNDIVYVPNIKAHKGTTYINDFNSNVKIQFGRDTKFTDIQGLIEKYYNVCKINENQKLIDNVVSNQQFCNNTFPFKDSSINDSYLESTIIKDEKWEIILLGVKASSLTEDNFIFGDLYI